MATKNSKIIDGRMQLGLVLNWILINKDLNQSEYWMYSVIARASLNQYHRRSVNIKQDEFKMNPKTLKKHRDSLVEKGLISWIPTKAYTAYKLEEPIDIIKNFKFRDKDELIDSKPDIKTQIKKNIFNN